MSTKTKAVSDAEAEMHLLGSFSALAEQLASPGSKVDGALWDEWSDWREEMIERGLLVSVPRVPTKPLSRRRKR